MKKVWNQNYDDNELEEELKNRKLRIMGYAFLIVYEKNLEDLPICADCQIELFKDLIEFLKKWELISEKLYKKLCKIYEEF